MACFKHNTELKNRMLYSTVIYFILNAAFYFGPWTFGILMTAVTAAGAVELAKCVKGHALPMLLCLAAGAVFAAINGYTFGVMAVIWLAVTFLTFSRKFSKLPVGRFCYIFSAAILGVGLICLVRLRIQAPELLLAALMAVCFNDAGGYVGGKLWGKHRIVQTISPHKTLEGYALGAVWALIAMAVCAVFMPRLISYPLWFICVAIVYLLFAGSAGDLLFSALKRRIGVKDFSSALGSHGGILDRFDSYIFFSPGLFILYHLMTGGF
jgi:phosphatidate cytidylyltransferase